MANAQKANVQRGSIGKPTSDVDFSERSRLVFIPESKYGIREGYYDYHALAGALRIVCHHPEVVRFIADMME